MKILIVGGTGVISTAITRELLERGEDVTLYNRGQTETRFSGRYKIIQGDRFDYPTFEYQIADTGTFDCVIDMITFTPEHAESAVRTFKGRTDQYIFCSTVNVYTKPAASYPITENAPRLQTNDDYGLNKARCEDIFRRAQEDGDFNVTLMRPAHTYDDTGAIIHTFGWRTSFLDRIRRRKPIVIHGDGSSFWVTCHAKDVGHAFVQAVGNEATYGKAYHVTGEEWMTWNTYHQKVAEAMDVPLPDIVYVPTDLLRRIDPERFNLTVTNLYGNTIFDNSAAKTDLDFKITVPWLDGARRTINWLESNGRIENSDDDPYYDRFVEQWNQASSMMIEQLKPEKT